MLMSDNKATAALFDTKGNIYISIKLWTSRISNKYTPYELDADTIYFKLGKFFYKKLYYIQMKYDDYL